MKTANKDLENLKIFIKKNSQLLEEWQDLINKAKETTFRESCLKDYLTECEPTYCLFKMDGQCSYFVRMSELNKLIDSK